MYNVVASAVLKEVQHRGGRIGRGGGVEGRMKGEGDIFLERVKWDLLIAKYLKFLRARV